MKYTGQLEYCYASKFITVVLYGVSLAICFPFIAFVKFGFFVESKDFCSFRRKIGKMFLNLLDSKEWYPRIYS